MKLNSLSRNARRALVAGVTSVLMLSVGTGVAFSQTGTDTPTREEALAAIAHARADLDTAEAYILADENNPPAETDVAAVATAAGANKVKLDWTTTLNPAPTGWRVARNGTDTNNTGPWTSGDLPANTNTFTFDLLQTGVEYTFTVTPLPTGNPATVTFTLGATNPTTPPPTTTTPPPAGGDGQTAASTFNWGTPVPARSDEFNYTGAPDPAKWYNPGSGGSCWSGHNGNGKRCGDRSNVDGSKLVMTGLANGDTGLIGQQNPVQYGRWEARVKSSTTNPGDNSNRQYHPVLIIWPANDVWPQNGEYDFLENGKPGEACAEAYIHYPHNPGAVQQEHAQETNCGAPLSEWHNVAIEWTPNHVKGFINGVQWFSFSGGANGTRQNIQNMTSGKMTIQLDNFGGTNQIPGQMELDWVRYYNI